VGGGFHWIMRYARVSAKMSPDLADDLNRPAVKLLRSVEVRVERGCQATNEKP
jgi:hypothetical protein